MTEPIKEIALSYLAAGLSVMPALSKEKRPVGAWKPYQKKLPTAEIVNKWFYGKRDSLCIITGAVSGNLEIIDFDMAGELFDAWYAVINESIRRKLIIERTPSGGYHVAFRCEEQVSGNLKLAQREPTPGNRVTLIETRGEGGLFLCAPTPGYEVVSDSGFADVQTLTADERIHLMAAACALDEVEPQPVSAPREKNTTSNGDGKKPGDCFNESGSIAPILEDNGWTQGVSSDKDNEHWIRPGKTFGTSATFNGNFFYVWSTSASPFEAGKHYSKFAVFAILEHGGDFTAAAKALAGEGFGDAVVYENEEELEAVDLSGIYERLAESSDRQVDPGPIPDVLLRVPGFVSEVMDYCLASAPYPNQAMAFCGALSLQGFLAGRKVRDSGDNRTNLYLLGLANSGTGKDAPRQVNVAITNAVEMGGGMGSSFASGEGLQDSLAITPNMLYQTDEFDGMLQSISKSKDARHEKIMTMLLELFSSANSTMKKRSKAGNEGTESIKEPCLSLFGTAIPDNYYGALSEIMLTNGFFARMLVVECGKRGKGQEPKIMAVPEGIIETAAWWRDYNPSGGNLNRENPLVATVGCTDVASQRLADARLAADERYDRADDKNDQVGRVVWTRVGEHIRKLALVYAVSENHLNPEIDESAVIWATDFVIHQAERMLCVATGHVSGSQFEANCKEVLRVMKSLHDAKGGRWKDWVPCGQVANRVRRLTTREHGDILDALVLQGLVKVDPVGTTTKGGRPGRRCRLSRGL